MHYKQNTFYVLNKSGTILIFQAKYEISKHNFFFKTSMKYAWLALRVQVVSDMCRGCSYVSTVNLVYYFQTYLLTMGSNLVWPICIVLHDTES